MHQLYPISGFSQRSPRLPAAPGWVTPGDALGWALVCGLVACAVLVTPVAAIAQSPVVKHRFIYETAPFPECHAATIVETAQGSLLAAWFGGTEEKHPDVAIWISRYDGEQWSEPVEIASGVQADGSRLPTWNPVLCQIKDGPLMLYFKVGPSPDTWWGEQLVSTDDGQTWSGRQRIPNDAIGPVKNKAIQLADGTLVSPSSDEADGWTAHVELSEDRGQSWKKIGPLNDGVRQRAIQPTLLQLGGEHLAMLCRDGVNDGHVWRSVSRDAGRSWSPLEATALPNPNSGIDAVTLVTGQHVLVYNHTVRSGPSPRGRERLGVALSLDGERWLPVLTLEEQKGEYSYPAIIQSSDGMLHVLYTWNRQKIRHVVLDPARMHPSDYADGQWPSEKLDRLPPAESAQ
jgi:predicted neuraminidase